MRLTLRTLLAYLDDTLEPAQTKLIGEKVAESPAAQELIARIRDVLRRRRLTTPATTGPDAKVDANAVAEYIDSVLPPEQLAEIEEICLNSDVHLAEVAASHQILTVVLSEPVLVPPTARRRMYGLVRGREAIPYRRAAAVASAAEAPVADDDQADETLLLGLPLYSRQGPWFRRLAPLAGVVLLALALVVAIALSMRGLDFQPGSRPSAPPAAASSPAAEPSASASAPATPTPPVVAPPLVARPKAPTGRIAAAVPPPAAGAAKTGSAVVNPAEEVHAQRPVPPPAPSNATTPKADAHTEVGTLVTLKDTPTLLLAHRDHAASWQRVRDGGPVATGDRLVALPGGQSQLALNSGAQVLLWGNLPDLRPGSILESSVVLHDTPEVELDATLVAGRIVVSRHRAGGPCRARIRFHNQVWDVTLGDEPGEVLLELGGEPNPATGPREGAAPVAGLLLVVLRGQADVKAGQETFAMRQPPGRAVCTWLSVTGMPRHPTQLAELPAWLVLKPPQGHEAQVLANLSRRLAAGDNPHSTLRSLLGDRDELTRRLAVLCLAATDDLIGLFDALGDDRHQDVRVGAIAALRHWLARDAGQQAKLEAALQERFGKGAAAIVAELLHTYTEQQRQEPGTWDSLTAYLTNERLAIRELANWHLVNLLPYIASKMPRYDLAGGPAERTRIYRLWKKYIPDGKLPPPPPAPAGEQPPRRKPR